MSAKAAKVASTAGAGILVGLILLACSGCSLFNTESAAPEPEEMIEMFYVDSTLFRIRLLEEFQSEEYGLAESFPVLFTNRSDSTLYLPLCGGSTPPPAYQRFVDGVWRDAIHLVRPAIGCTESLAVEPGESHSEMHGLIFKVEPTQLPLDGDMPQIEDVYGRYRMRFEVYRAPWSEGPAPPEVQLTKEDMYSNSFNIVAAE